MRDRSTPGVSIGAVARRTGIPVTTLRFYERELPGLFPIRKTSGGHRRYGARDVSRFSTIRTLTEEGLPLSELRHALGSRGGYEVLREAIDRLAQAQEAGGRALEELTRRVEQLEARLAERSSRSSRKGWFGNR
jgi:DNA-binding transcriptional MerR regulator